MSIAAEHRGSTGDGWKAVAAFEHESYCSGGLSRRGSGAMALRISMGLDGQAHSLKIRVYREALPPTHKVDRRHALSLPITGTIEEEDLAAHSRRKSDGSPNSSES